MPFTAAELRAFYSRRPVVLAPMEDVSDRGFRGLCRELGAELCFTEFVRVEQLLAGAPKARRKVRLEPGDAPTAIQIYGSDQALLAEAARAAEEAAPAFLDLNCGCWVPSIRRGGAGAGWLRHPDAMVAMAKMVVERTSLPVTVKTRIGLGHEAQMPIVELGRRLEDVGVQAITLHCRTARMGYEGTADWSYATALKRAVGIPVVVNGDVRSADDAARALSETGCDAVMIGRRAIEHPWIFREARAVLDGRPPLAPPSAKERLTLLRRHLLLNVEQRGAHHGVQVTRRTLTGYLEGVEGGVELRRALLATLEGDGCLALIDAALARRVSAVIDEPR